MGSLVINNNIKHCVVIFYPHIGEYGGIERNIIGLATEIIAKGYQPLLLCYYDRIDISKYAGFTIPTTIIKDHWNPFVKSLRLRTWYKHNREYIHGLPFLFGAKAGYYAALAFIPKYALHYTDPPSLVKSAVVTKGVLKRSFISVRSALSGFIIALGVKRASICITMTNRNAVELASIYGRKFEVVYQGGVPQMTATATGGKCQSRSLQLFSICRVASSKNLDWIVYATKALKSDPVIATYFDSFKVTIAGKGPDLQRLEAIVVEEGLQLDINFAGFMDSETVEQYYRTADIFLVPGVQGYGLTVLEALYRATPVVLNEASRISEFLFDNTWVRISDNSLASYTEQLISHIHFLRANNPNIEELKNLPTEPIWAGNIGKLCNWW